VVHYVCAFHSQTDGPFVADVALYKFNALWSVVRIQYVKYAHPFTAVKQACDEQVTEVSGTAGYYVQISH
jgi:hypothetical protein